MSFLTLGSGMNKQWNGLGRFVMSPFKTVWQRFINITSSNFILRKMTCSVKTKSKLVSKEFEILVLYQSNLLQGG